MKIQEIEGRTGLDRASIRFYEREGILSPKRLENGYRDYSDADAELLKKVKLLRRLGMSINAIRKLQEGSEDLSSAILTQIQYHSDHISEHRRCRTVCQAIYDDAVTFETLDAGYYTALFQKINNQEKSYVSSQFREELPEEIHPWRRFLARVLDYGLWNGFLLFIIVVVLRIRPAPMNLGLVFVEILSAASFVPVEAFLLHKFGTTLGKLAMGIRLEYIQGGFLSWGDALRRSSHVFAFGTGCGVPVIKPALMVYRYCKLTGRSTRRFARYNEVDYPEDMPWDEETEIIYDEIWKKQAILTAILVVIILIIEIFTGLDSIKPKYRGSELTVAEFAENYNSYLYIVQEQVETYNKLQPDGAKHPVPFGTYIISLNGREEEERAEFQYELENGFIHSITFEGSWYDIFYFNALSGEPTNAAMSLLLAQDGCGIKELTELESLFESHQDQKEAEFSYKNLTISWRIDSEQPMVQGIIFGGEDEAVNAELYFRVIIQS